MVSVKVKKFFVYIFTIFVMMSVILNINEIDDVLGIYPEKTEYNFYKYLKKPEFVHLGGSSFKTVGSPPVYANDCVGCGDLGDISVDHSSVSAELTRHIFDANCGGIFDFVQKGSQVNENGETIGERCVVSEIFGAPKIMWTESENDLWSISAPTLRIAREFERSEAYKNYRQNAK